MGKTAIPKKLHIIWIGDESKTPWDNIETWQAKHTDWEFKLWGNDDLKNHNWQRQDIIDAYLSIESYPAVADVMRYQILKDEGGFVAPADSICLHNIEPLLDDCEALAVYENETVRPGLISPLYASTKNNELPTCLLDNMKMMLDENDKPLRPVFVTGNYFMREIVESREWKDLKILPSYRFNPIHFTGHKYTGSGKVYAVQTWGDTSARGKGIKQFEVDPKWL